MSGAILAVGVITGCSGGKPAVKPEPAEPIEPDGDAKIGALCDEVCKAIGEKCGDDPAADFEVEPCVGTCTDETDGVIEDTGKCVEAAADCAAALECRDELGD